MATFTDNPSAATAELVVSGPEGEPLRFALVPGPPVIIGRGAGCGVRLENEQVSRQHAELSCGADGRWVLRDLGSRNGVLLHGVRLSDPTPLKPGIRLQIGPYTLTLKGEPVGPPAPAPETDQYYTVAAVDDRKTSTVQPITHTPRRFDPAILSKLHQLDQWLMDLPERSERYRRLCEFVIQSNAGAHYCAVLDAGEQGDASVRVLQAVARQPNERPYLSRTLLDQVESTGEPTQLSNTADPGGEDIMLSIAPEKALLSAIACPLEEGQGGPIFYATFHANEVDGSWLDLMVLIADQYQHAEAMLSVMESANERAALDRDLARGREIQNGLLPAPWDGDGLDIAYGFRPCHMVGGDYLDVVPMPDGRVLLAIADVTGKGLQAALIASSIHTMVHAVVQTGGDLATIYTQLNNYLIHFAPTGSFATMILAAIDPSDGSARVLNAGHPPIVVVDDAGQSSALELEPRHLPLGIDVQEYTSAATEIAPGASWFFYTDGLSELPLPEGGMLGVEGVTRVTAELAKPDAAQTIDAWMKHMQTHNDEQGQADDQTLICIRRPC